MGAVRPVKVEPGTPVAAIGGAGSWDAGARLWRRAEPARSPDRAELLLLRGELSRGSDQLCRRRRSAEEVGLDLADKPAAKLDVAVAGALVWWGRLVAADPRGDVLRHHPGGGLGEYTCLGHRQACHVADRI